MSLKSRLNKLEKDNTPKSDVNMTLHWGDADETPAEKAKREAERPVVDENGVPIRYIDIKWADDPDIPGPTVDDETRIRWAEDVLGGGGSGDD